VLRPNRELLRCERKVKIGITAIWRFYGVTRSPSKKTLHAAEQARPDIAAARAELQAEQIELDVRRLVFIDETAVTTKMIRAYGRCRRGQRLNAYVPHGHWKTLTLVAALRIDGLTAPYVVDGAMDGPSFLAYVEQVLAHTAQARHRIHGQFARSQGRRSAWSNRSCRSNGALLACLSPDLNPIEQAFSKLKMALRKGAARKLEALLRLIGRVIKSIAPEECANYFRHAG
jgi:transposase